MQALIFSIPQIFTAGAKMQAVRKKLSENGFKQGDGRRERTVLATKVYGDMHDAHDGPNREAGLSAYKIRRHLEGSLKRLQTDHIELYQMHHVDRSVNWSELWGAFETAVSQGKIGYIGSSNFAGWDIAVAQGEAKARGSIGLVSEQHKYNLLCRLPELEVLPASQAARPWRYPMESARRRLACGQPSPQGRRPPQRRFEAARAASRAAGCLRGVLR